MSHCLAGVLACALVAPGASFAQREDHGHQHYDNSHGHNRYYPERGARFERVPEGARFFEHHGDRYWFHEGIWYRGFGGGFVVVGAPYGLYVPVLPAFATLVVLGGMQYYYANDTYYLFHPELNQYEIVAPPAVTSPPPPASSSAAPANESLYVYPKNGQGQEQQAADRYECHRWAADQTGFDPTRVAGGVAGDVAAKRADYLRAQAACLEARGYTVR
jgi:hypothetical protein